MSSPTETAVPKTGTPKDPRQKLIQVTIKRSQKQPDALIQILHAVQNMYGHLPEDIIRLVAKELRLPPSRVYGVTTFYNFFSLKPQGEHTCLVCTGTACYVKGAEELLKHLEVSYGLKRGEVTKDHRLGLQTARCVGACGLAPVIILDEQVHSKVTAETINGLIDGVIGEQA